MFDSIGRIAHSFRHLFFPHICAGCGSDNLSEKQLICLRCSYHLPVTQFEQHAANPVEKIFWGRLPVQAGFSHYYFTKDSVLQNLLHELKYQGNQDVGHFMGREMGHSIMNSNRLQQIDAVIPLPLHPKRERERGYNQATVIGEGISEITGLPVWANKIIRTAATETQTHKTRIERWQNMEGRFRLKDPESLRNKTILLVDDVITTGSTLEACGTELLKAPGSQLIIGAVAWAMK